MSDVDIAIRTYSTDPTPKPHTVYHIQIRLALRSYTLTKRYSQFAQLASDLESAVGEELPFKLPKKHVFGNSVTNIERIEERRAGLERFLREVQRSSDARWRLTDAYREFMGLTGAGNGVGGSSSAPSILSSGSSNAALTLPSGKLISDPIVWLDTLHEVKTLLHETRNYLSDRDSLALSGSVRNGVLESHSASAEAKKCLVQAGTKIVMLDRGLRELGNYVGQGEIRRRGDMLALVKKEKEGLESLASTVSRNSAARTAAASTSSANDADSHERSALLSGGVLSTVASSAKRVLGPITETSETRPLDNRGLVSLQMKKMDEQDQMLLEFEKILARQKQLAVDINDELELQNEMIGMLDEDVDKSKGKLNRASKQLKKIS
ncbi:uncharacterized protein V1518DRAFT_416427 [Limtongia smithiae]|uniref:uncharacterized protein n=1 Tax=Limtongia smithiae TaxID=1125753 RepID=UPI0034CE39B7